MAKRPTRTRIAAEAPATEAECREHLAKIAELEAACDNLKQRVELCRQSFFRLAQVRAADLVKYERQTWDAGATYINTEMAALDNQLAQLAPPKGEA